ncbi:hypothetical protein BDY19DRAFT_113179 [Irpex rosettiformis]|uniref:Uncharacterized protein n=1 Tax=Irpex rosettiformis TaxID=378272 RepID=A0ACB8U6L4_9APHY|nr:hypothetical protein BDY19DRAFT_113179 [Irpex rosettiformis]
MPPTTISSDKPYRISTSEYQDEDFKARAHALDDSAVRKTIPLGDICGLTKLGVHIVRLPPHSKSSTLHWHVSDEEWVYILESGEHGATLVTLPQGEAEKTREETVSKGDFIAFRAASGMGHVICTGDEEITYLCSGTREPMDVCTYPLQGKKLVVNRRGGPRWYVNEDDIEFAVRK